MSRLAVPKTYKLYIGGKFPRSESGRTYEVTTPAGEFVANAASAHPDGEVKIVRPDAYIGWAGVDDPAAIRAYLETHAGQR